MATFDPNVSQYFLPDTGDGQGQIVGYDSQGRGIFQTADGRYMVMSKGEDNLGPEGNQYGGYYQYYDPQGQLTGDPQYQQYERSQGWFGENVDWLGPALVLGFAGAAAALANGSAATVAEAVASTNVAAEAAPIVESAITNLGPSATINDVLAYAGVPVSESVKTAISQAGLTLSSPAASVLKSAAGTALNSMLGGGGTGNVLGGLLSGGVNTALGLDGIDKIREVGDWANDQYVGAGAGQQQDLGMLGGQIRDQYYDWADNVQNMYTGLGTELGGMEKTAATDASNRWNAFGDNIVPMYNQVRDTYAPQYKDLAKEVKQSVGTFKPYNITTNIGVTDKDKFTATPGIQRVSDQAVTASGNAFSAANDFDLANMREQEYGMMKGILAPEDLQKRIGTEERLRAQGRLDVAGGQGYNPQMYALEQGLANRDLNLLFQADDQAMKRYQDYLGAGNTALEAPLAIDRSAQGMLTLGSNLGRQEFDAGIQGANTWAPYAQRAIDYPANLDLRTVDQHLGYKEKGIEALNTGDQQAIDRYAPLAETGINKFWDFNQKGFDQWGNLSKQGIDAKYGGIIQGIKAKFGSEQAALRALEGLYKAIGGTANSMLGGASGIGNTLDQGLNTVLSFFTDQGMTDDQAYTMIDNMLSSTVEGYLPGSV